MKTLHFSKSFLSFIHKKEGVITRLLSNAIMNEKYYGYPVFDLLIDTSQINYLTFRSNGNISFLPNGKNHVVNDNGDWSRENRQEGKASKVIRKLFTKKALKLLKDKDFEQFSNTYKSEFCTEGFKLELLPGNKIPEVYSMKRCEGDGSLQGSCMNDDTGYLDIYKNCKSLSILILTDANGLLACRALVWKIDNEITFMDRIYVTHDWQFELFVNHAVKNKFWYKEHYKSYDNKQDLINPAGNKEYKTLKVFTDTDFNAYPYIDTFSYGGNGYLTNSSRADYTYNNTNGTRDGDESEDEDEDEDEDEYNEQMYDSITGRYIDAGDSIYINAGSHAGECTYYDNAVCVNRYWYYIGDEAIQWIDSRNEYYLAEDTRYSEHEGESYHEDDVVYIESENDHYLKTSEDIVEIEGDYYLKTSEDIVEIEGDYYLKTSEEIIFINGSFYKKQLELIFED